MCFVTLLALQKCCDKQLPSGYFIRRARLYLRAQQWSILLSTYANSCGAILFFVVTLIVGLNFVDVNVQTSGMS